LAATYGVDPRRFHETAIARTSLRPFVGRYIERGFSPDSPSSFKIELAAKDAAYAAEALRSAGLNALVAAATASAYAEAVSHGYRERDCSTLLYYRVNLARRA
jgi:3-hydroxyisobutyrate dehydrogenase-like beta-hydroxyacid dehydrogenase